MTENPNNSPTHSVFLIKDLSNEGEEKKGFWIKIGAAWEHKDGNGLNIVLDAMPVDGRLVLRKREEEETKQ